MIKCPNCTAQITYKVTDKVVKCDYCGGTFSPEELNAIYNVADENVTKELFSLYFSFNIFVSSVTGGTK